ncbi:hypothetical protein EPN87_00035 [archaeon]|nr:MAG: hypothetical protein EPN87_00035 [archaeon]
MPRKTERTKPILQAARSVGELIGESAALGEKETKKLAEKTQDMLESTGKVISDAGEKISKAGDSLSEVADELKRGIKTGKKRAKEKS